MRVGQLDKAIDQFGKTAEEAPSASGFGWQESEPWPHEVSGATLLDEITYTIRRFLVLPEYAAEAMALWVIFSHTLDLWSISPRLAFLSPEKRCGKTTALSVVQQLVSKPLPASNITPAATFRSIALYQPTLLIDEADTFLRDNHELRGILNSGHNRAQAYVVRTVGEDHEPRQFSTWSPVVIAMIGKLPDTLQDRSIVVELRRKTSSDVVERFRLDKVEEFGSLRSKIGRWVDDTRLVLSRLESQVPAGLNDRAADNWRPLLTIADAAGGNWPELARRAAMALAGSVEDSSKATQLLQDIFDLFIGEGIDRLPTHRILQHLNSMEERPWPEWRQGKPITAQQMARQLRPFGVAPKALRMTSSETIKGYEKAAFDDAFARYLPPQPVTASQSNEINNLTTPASVTMSHGVTDPPPDNVLKSNNCYGVTDQDSPPPGVEWPSRRRVAI